VRKIVAGLAISWDDMVEAPKKLVAAKIAQPGGQR
jgi:hypothetical protein